jgi:2-keto-4-pentenoate hydratase/2-oxohepta-3-ene-1,7-dioic acid hydratase in catechol pathway
VKILRFNDDRIGVLKDGDRVVDVSSAISYRAEKGPKRVIEEVIENFDDYRQKFAQIVNRESGVALNSVQLRAPIPQPNKCLAAFVNYLDRPDRSPESLTIEYFYKCPEMVGPDKPIELADIPAVTVFNPEAELAFVIGKRAKNVSQADAMYTIFGYVPFFDVSARGLTRRTTFLGKGQDTHAAIGPWITTKDEVPDPHNLTVKSWVGEEARQNYNTRYMAYKIPEQIAWLTRFVQLCPGDIVATGTYHEGLGPVNGGDVLEIEIERLGRAKFHIKGYGPRKVAKSGGGGQAPAGNWTKV